MKTPLDAFNGCTKGDFNTTKGKVDWRVEGTELFFQPSHGLTDWMKNLLIFPIPVIWGGYLVFIPIGIALDIRELSKILKSVSGITHVYGYSRGGWEAVLSSMKLKVVCTTFGCPGVFWKPSKKVKSFLYHFVTHYENPDDIVCTVPIGYDHGPTVIKLYGRSYIQEVNGFDEALERDSGHSPSEYRFRLEGVQW